MYFYFLSPTPCALKYNGQYVGAVRENYAVLQADKGLFEFLPLSPEYSPVYLDQSQLAKTSKSARIIDLYGGLLIIPRLRRQQTSDYETIFYKEADFGDFKAEIEIYEENGTKVKIDGLGGEKTEGIPFRPKSVEIERARISGKNYLLLFLSDKRTLALGFELGKGVRTVFRQTCDGYRAADDYVVVTEVRNDLLKRTVSVKWAFNEKPTPVSVEIKRGREIYALPNKLLPYAFLEEIRLGRAPSDFLSPRLKPRASDLKKFLGDFDAFLPPPHFRGDDEITLLYGDKVEYARFSVRGGQIENVELTTDGK